MEQVRDDLADSVYPLDFILIHEFIILLVIPCSGTSCAGFSLDDIAGSTIPSFHYAI